MSEIYEERVIAVADSDGDAVEVSWRKEGGAMAALLFLRSFPPSDPHGGTLVGLSIARARKLRDFIDEGLRALRAEAPAP